MLAQNKPDFLDHTPVPLTTDDWPYLYSANRTIPPTYYTVAILLLIIATMLYFQIPEVRGQRPSMFFFAMGAGFLLLETQTISRLALFFGTTWVVNGIVIAAVLITLMLSNIVADKFGQRMNSKVVGVLLLLSLVAAYAVPMAKLSDSADVAGTIAAAIFAVPVFMAGLLFGTEFGKCSDPRLALGSNMLGAVLGGLLENISFISGMRSLLLVAVVVYAIAVLSARARKGIVRSILKSEAAAAGR